MFNQRIGLPHAVLLLGFAIPFGWSGSLIAHAGGHLGAYLQLADTRHQLAEYSTTVFELQRELNQLGFDAGPENGLMSARTRGAIKAYQRDKRLPVEGLPTASLLSHVRATAQDQTPIPAAPISGNPS